jgi:hypothetical protein
MPLVGLRSDGKSQIENHAGHSYSSLRELMGETQSYTFLYSTSMTVHASFFGH